MHYTHLHLLRVPIDRFDHHPMLLRFLGVSTWLLPMVPWYGKKVLYVLLLCAAVFPGNGMYSSISRHGIIPTIVRGPWSQDSLHQPTMQYTTGIIRYI